MWRQFWLVNSFAAFQKLHTLVLLACGRRASVATAVALAEHCAAVRDRGTGNPALPSLGTYRHQSQYWARTASWPHATRVALNWQKMRATRLTLPPSATDHTHTHTTASTNHVSSVYHISVLLSTEYFNNDRPHVDNIRSYSTELYQYKVSHYRNQTFSKAWVVQ